MDKNNHYFYVLECSDGSYYAGYTNNIDKRLLTHNEGKGAKYTRGRRPVVLRYRELCENYSIALRREIAIKRLSRNEKLSLCHKYDNK